MPGYFHVESILELQTIKRNSIGSSKGLDAEVISKVVKLSQYAFIAGLVGAFGVIGQTSPIGTEGQGNLSSGGTLGHLRTRLNSLSGRRAHYEIEAANKRTWAGRD